jgi:hypothetical protein
VVSNPGFLEKPALERIDDTKESLKGQHNLMKNKRNPVALEETSRRN